MGKLALLIAGFFALSGFLAAIDAAVLSVSRAEIEEMVKQGKLGAISLRRLHSRLTRAVVIIVIATNLVNVLGPITVGYRSVALYGDAMLGIITAVLTFGTIVFSEIIPKSLGAHYAPLISRLVALPILVLVYLLFPIVYSLERLVLLFQSGRRIIGTEDQIRALVTIGHRAGHIESDEGQLIHRAFILNDKTAADLMTPLKNIVSVTTTSTVREAAQLVFKHTYSRYPVFGSSIHNVEGVVMSKDVLEALAQGKDNEPVSSIMRDPLVVSARRRADDLIVQFRDRHIHLAIVQDHGNTVGLVTLEDALEELVGEIEDETDVES